MQRPFWDQEEGCWKVEGGQNGVGWGGPEGGDTQGESRARTWLLGQILPSIPGLHGSDLGCSMVLRLVVAKQQAQIRGNISLAP